MRRVTESKPKQTVTERAFLALERPEGSLGIRVGREVVAATSLDKVYWAKEGYTKADLLAYYLSVGRLIMPFLKGRPAILKRHPEGIDGEAFFQHDVTSGPEYLRIEVLTSETGRRLNYAVYTSLASLVYLVNIGTIAQNPWHATVDRLDRPDWFVVDLDPKGAPWRNVLEVALATRDELGRDGLEGFVKTSGSSGIHVYVPLEPRYGYAEVAAYAARLAARVAEARPKIATVERSLAERKRNQVYVDWQQNATGKSAASVYSVRARPKATVSAPVTWEEVEGGVKITDFTIATMPARLEEVGDLWAGFWRGRQALPR
jgi:bifunctional non-homologous end joining protein LigD